MKGATDLLLLLLLFLLLLFGLLGASYAVYNIGASYAVYVPVRSFGS